jgi:hypothetical protein
VCSSDLLSFLSKPERNRKEKRDGVRKGKKNETAPFDF